MNGSEGEGTWNLQVADTPSFSASFLPVSTPVVRTCAHACTCLQPCEMYVRERGGEGCCTGAHGRAGGREGGGKGAGAEETERNSARERERARAATHRKAHHHACTRCLCPCFQGMLDGSRLHGRRAARHAPLGFRSTPCIVQPYFFAM